MHKTLSVPYMFDACMCCCFVIVYHYKVTFHTAKGLFADLTAGAPWIKLIGDNGVSEEIILER